MLLGLRPVQAGGQHQATRRRRTLPATASGYSAAGGLDPPGSRAYLNTGGEGGYPPYRNRAATGLLEFPAKQQPYDLSQSSTSATMPGQQIPLPFALRPAAPADVSITTGNWR